MEKQEKEEIESLLSDYQDALNTGNAQKSVGLYTKDGIFMPAEAPTAMGAEEILGSYQYFFSQIRLSIRFYIQEISIEGDFAYAVTASNGDVLLRAANLKAHQENRELFVFEKENGKWKIARNMFNKT